jgi:hypothetical protein
VLTRDHWRRRPGGPCDAPERDQGGRPAHSNRRDRREQRPERTCTRVGLFRERLPAVKDGIPLARDHEYLLRLLAHRPPRRLRTRASPFTRNPANRSTVLSPSLASRPRTFHALLIGAMETSKPERSLAFPRISSGRLAGRSLFDGASNTRGESAAALHDVRLRFFYGFLRTRRRIFERRRQARDSPLEHLTSGAR